MREVARDSSHRVAMAATIGELLDEVTALCQAGGIEAPRRDAVDILVLLLGVSRGWVGSHPTAPASDDLAAAALEAGARRSRGMPLEYAVGRAAFRSLVLRVDERVLIPRPETEGLVELVLADAGKDGGTAVDVGTGSGAIAIALALEGRYDAVIGTDISEDALAVARANARDLVPTGRPIDFRSGAGLDPVIGVEAAAVVANPPYISWSEASALPSSVRDWEPAAALFSEDEGLRATQAIIGGAPRVLAPRGLLALEVDARRAEQVARAVQADGRYDDVTIKTDLAGRQRYVLARRASAT